MKVQSLSIHVPTTRCINNCMGCVSRMHKSPYKNRIGEMFEVGYNPTSHIEIEYIRRLMFAKENGVNNVILTGTGEPLQNMEFLRWFGDLRMFDWIELQTTGDFLLDTEEIVDKKSGKIFQTYPCLNFLRDIGVSTISLSIWDLFDSQNNDKLIQRKNITGKFIEKTCEAIKKHNFNLRLSLNIHDIYKDRGIWEFFIYAKDVGADQITFRKLFKTNCSPSLFSEQDKWIEANTKHDQEIFNRIDNYILGESQQTLIGEKRMGGKTTLQKFKLDREKGAGKFLGVLPFGAKKYSVDGITTVIDGNCMDNVYEREDPDVYKYMILRPNCKLYSEWDDPGSLIF